MRALGILLSAAGFAAGGALVLAPAADAAPTGCGSPKIVSASYLRRFGGTPVVGSIQLKRDSCYRYWGELYMYDRMPANTFATAYLTKFDGGAGATFSCDSKGGTGRIRQGDTTCRTPKVSAPGGNLKFVASGHEYHGGDGWAKVSWGQTARTR